MTASRTAGSHFLLYVTDLWADAPAAIGVFTSDADALSAAHAAQADAEPGFHRYTLEEWRGTTRQSSQTVSTP